MSENEFLEILGDSYRGSKYANFAGGGVDAQGNISSAQTENSATAVGTSAEAPVQQGAPTSSLTASQGLTGVPEAPGAAELVIGAALPIAGKAIGSAAGAAIGAGAPIGEAVSHGISSFASKASGGLIGSSTPTSAQLLAAPSTSGASSAAGAASAGKVAAGASAGAAIGSGFATAALTLLQGGTVKDAAKAGIGTAVGTYIGTAIAGPIGGFIGGFIGSLFCFTEGSPILMADGTQKNIEDLKMHDEVLYGGRVMACGTALVETLYEYKNTVVSSQHAVFEDGKWIRVEQSENAVLHQHEEGEGVVYPVATENNILITPWYISADLLEAPEDEVDGMTYSEIIAYLNTKDERNEILSQIEKEVCTA